MNNNTRKIVVLNDLDSPRIEQAIFILREKAVTSEKDAVSEAQKIVDIYAKSLEVRPPEPEEKKKPRFGFFLGMMLYTFMTAVLTAYLVAMK